MNTPFLKIDIDDTRSLTIDTDDLAYIYADQKKKQIQVVLLNKQFSIPYENGFATLRTKITRRSGQFITLTNNRDLYYYISKHNVSYVSRLDNKLDVGFRNSEASISIDLPNVIGQVYDYITNNLG